MDDSVRTHSTENIGTPSYLLICKPRPPRRQAIERALMMLGIALSAYCVSVKIQGAVFSRWAVQNFKASQESLSLSFPLKRHVRDASPIDVSLWSQHRLNAFRQAVLGHINPTLALLRINGIDLEVPVLDGTDEVTLNRGVGWIHSTTRPGKPGNVGIAGHRDGFFRSLKDLKLGDTMDLVTQGQSNTFVVDSIRVVNPEDVSVLNPTRVQSLTLVTCYPFYFVGNAPQRYIVHASISPPRSFGERAIEQIFLNEDGVHSHEFTEYTSLI
jgi:sortase A